jgi:hypothetical protein
MMSPESTAARFVLAADHPVSRLQRQALIVGVLALAASGVGAILSPEQFFRSYLVAFMFWFGIALGCMAILMIHHVSGGAWGAVIRRVLESASRTLPLMALLFLPMVLGLQDLYKWARPEVVALDPALQHKSLYLNVPFFLVRAVVYFAVWSVLALFLSRWSREQDQTTDPGPGRRLELLSRGGLLLVGLTMTFAAVDWAMSLEPHWYSTIYGILIMGGQVLAGMSFVIPVAALLAQEGPLTGVVTAEQFHDLGKLLLAFVMLWAYFSLSQFLITWAGNLPEEIPWYVRRLQGGWQILGVGLVLFQFVIPFVILLSRDIKRRARSLALLAVGIICVRFVDLFWMIAPAFNPDVLSVHWLDLSTLAGVGGVWLSVFIWQLKGHSLVAIHDPSLPESVR